MENMTLTPRLALAASLVPQGARLADIGTDHGKLPIQLLLSGRVRAAIGSDIRQGPLAHAARNAKEHGVELPLRLAPGLSGISPEECDTITIAGMGGETIAEILEAAPWLQRGEHLLILQAMTMQPHLRRWLAGHGYETLEERICREDKKLYTVQMVRGGGKAHTLSEIDAAAPETIRKDPLAGEYLNRLLQRAETVLRGLRAGKSVDAEQLAAQQTLTEALRARWEEWK